MINTPPPTNSSSASKTFINTVGKLPEQPKKDGVDLASSALKKVKILVPFKRITGCENNLNDPHGTSTEWQKVKSQRGLERNKTYSIINRALEPKSLSPDDRLYIHGHGAVGSDVISSSDDSDTISATQLAKQIKQALNDETSTARVLDIRTASCYSADGTRPFAKALATALGKQGIHARVKGYTGQLNVIEMTRGTTRRRSGRENPVKLAGIVVSQRQATFVDMHDASRIITHPSGANDSANFEYRAKNKSKTFNSTPSNAAKARNIQGTKRSRPESSQPAVQTASAEASENRRRSKRLRDSTHRL